MQSTTNYSMNLVEGTDLVNIPVQLNPNFQTIDQEMFANKQSTVGTASEVVTGTVHAIVRNNTDSDVFRFTATGAWTAGDTMTLDGVGVTVHLSDGTTPATNSYIIGAEVLAMVNGTLVTLAISTTPPAQGVTSFNSRTGAVVPTASDYDASMIDYDNTISGLNATDVQGAIDELASTPSGLVVDELWTNNNLTVDYAAQPIMVAGLSDYRYYELIFRATTSDATYNSSGLIPTDASYKMIYFGNFVFARDAAVTGNTITFSDCKYLNPYGAGGAWTTLNSACIPYKILGIK